MGDRIDYVKELQAELAKAEAERDGLKRDVARRRSDTADLLNRFAAINDERFAAEHMLDEIEEALFPGEPDHEHRGELTHAVKALVRDRDLLKREKAVLRSANAGERQATDEAEARCAKAVAALKRVAGYARGLDWPEHNVRDLRIARRRTAAALAVAEHFAREWRRAVAKHEAEAWFAQFNLTKRTLGMAAEARRERDEARGACKRLRERADAAEARCAKAIAALKRVAAYARLRLLTVWTRSRAHDPA